MALPFGVSCADLLMTALKAAGLPAVTVFCGVPTDRTTWTVTLAANATAQQLAAAEAIRAVFDPESVAAHDAENDARANRLADDVIARSVARVTWEELKKFQLRNNQTAATWEQFRDAIKAEIKARLSGGA